MAVVPHRTLILTSRSGSVLAVSKKFVVKMMREKQAKMEGNCVRNWEKAVPDSDSETRFDESLSGLWPGRHEAPCKWTTIGPPRHPLN